MLLSAYHDSDSCCASKESAVGGAHDNALKTGTKSAAMKRKGLRRPQSRPKRVRVLSESHASNGSTKRLSRVLKTRAADITLRDALG